MRLLSLCQAAVCCPSCTRSWQGTGSTSSPEAPPRPHLCQEGTECQHCCRGNFSLQSPTRHRPQLGQGPASPPGGQTHPVGEQRLPPTFSTAILSGLGDPGPPWRLTNRGWTVHWASPQVQHSSRIQADAKSLGYFLLALWHFPKSLCIHASRERIWFLKHSWSYQ